MVPAAAKPATPARAPTMAVAVPPVRPAVSAVPGVGGARTQPRKSHMGLVLVIGALVIVPLILLLAGGALVAMYYFKAAAVTPPPVPPTPYVNPIGGPIDKPEPTPAASGLTRDAEGSYDWNAKGAGETAAIYFDNGGDKAVTIDVESGGSINVEPGKRTKLVARAGDLALAITGGDSAAEQYKIHMEANHTYIYNPHAAWDYVIETHVYSTMGLGPKPAKEILTGLVLFDAGDVDYPFADAPGSITLPGFGNATRTSLDHDGTKSYDDRTLRLARGPGGMVRIVTVPDGPYVVQSTTDLTLPVYVRVDNPYKKTLDLQVDGTSVCAIEADGDETLYLTPGEHALAGRGIPAAHLECALKAGKKYVWEPEGLRSFDLDYQYYGSAMLNPGKRDKMSFRGLVFFELHTDYAFEEFPDTASLSGMEMAGAWRSRLGWGDTSDTESDVIDDLNAVEASAREGLPAAKWRLFVQRLPRRHSPVNDCDVYLARALLLGIKGDAKGAQILLDGLDQVIPDDAQRHRIEGLMDYDQKDYEQAQMELARAVDLDATLSAELKPIIAECEKAPRSP